MALLLKNKVIFIHVPKTAGSWVVHCLKHLDLVVSNIGPAHADHERITNFSGHYLGAYFKKSLMLRCSADQYFRECQAFAFVREPLSYYESWWRYMEDVNWKRFSHPRNQSRLGLKADLWHPYGIIESWGRLPFDAFIERILSEYPGFLANLYEKYIPFGSGVVVGKQENLVSDMKNILERLYGPGRIGDIPIRTRVNASKTPKPHWRADLRKELVMNEHVVYRRFQYSIPEGIL